MKSRYLIACILVFTGHSASAQLPTVKEFDIIFHTSSSNQSVAIQKATDSLYSHVGIILFCEEKPYVYEAISTVKYTPLEDWIDRGVDKHFVVKRLRHSEDLLTTNSKAALRKNVLKYINRPYDLKFEWSDNRIYCSELVWKIFNEGLGIRLGNLQRFGDFYLSDPAVKSKMRERFGDSIPMDERVISPHAVFESKYLQTVAESP